MSSTENFVIVYLEQDSIFFYTTNNKQIKATFTRFQFQNLRARPGSSCVTWRALLFQLDPQRSRTENIKLIFPAKNKNGLA